MELPKEHIDNLASIRTGTNDIIKRINLLRTENKKLTSNKDRDRICSTLIKEYIMPMENAMLNLYISANNLQEHFKAPTEEVKK
jgi:hypothetical protein